MMFDHPAKLRQLLRVEPDLAEEGGHHCHRQCSLERASGENKYIFDNFGDVFRCFFLSMLTMSFRET